ncbi:MAG TPA: ABC transporter permease [Candidatus Acidoferrum sp.]|nr:ABC transporter permease [Candidatus Acidoferrum sp.]
MVWTQRFWLKWQSLFRRSRSSQRLNDEMQFHLDQQIAENLASGMSPEEARHAAMRTFGNATFLKEETRDAWGWLWLEHLAQDFRYGLRSLRKGPGFSAIAILSLALGIMATTAMYSVIYDVVLNPFPYRDVDSLMSVKVWSPDSSHWRFNYTVDQFLEIAERNSIFQGTIASTVSDVEWTSEGEPKRLRGNVCTMNTFDVMGVPPLIGRTPTAADSAPGATPVAVLGYKFWTQQFGGDPSVLGRSMRLNDTVRTVIGVMPPRFMWRGADVYVPIVFHRGEFLEGVHYVHLLGRLKPGVTEAQAETDLRPIIADLKQRKTAAFPDKWRVGLLSFKESFPSGLREVLWILFGAVGMLLLIACANVSNLLLSRAATRQREIALRASLGATRGRLVRQLLAESVLLSIIGGALGAALAFGALRVILSMVPPDSIPDESKVAIDQPVLLFTLCISFVTALLFGLAPALHASRTQLVTALKESARGAGAGFRRISASGGLVVVEVALSLVLVVGATLMMRTVMAIENQNLGIRTDRLLTIRVPLSPKRYADASHRLAFFKELLRRVEALPGVASASMSIGMHPFFGGMETPVEVAGAAQMDTRPVVIFAVSRDYMKVFGIGLMEGRPFSDADMAGVGRWAIVNQSFVRRYFPSSAPLGRIVRVPRLSSDLHLADDSVQIVGVVNDVMNRGLTREIAPELYLPYSIAGDADILAVLTNTDPAALAKPVTEQVYGLDPDQPVTDVRTMNSLLSDWEYSGPRFSVVLLAVFAALGLILAVVGVYGVVSNAVAQRTHEIGVRKALGAGSGDVLRLVFRFGARFILPGIAIGLAASIAAARLLASQLWHVSPHDPVALVSVVVLLLAVGFLACWVPARRAMRVDPIVALRYE